MKRRLLYSKKYYQKGTSFLPRLVLGFLRFLEIRNLKKIKKTGRVLDVGCGDGGFLEACQKAGFEVFGQDTSFEAVSAAGNRDLLDIYQKEIWDCGFTKNYFDIITLRHVIEHIEKPEKLLVEIKRILKADGVFIISTPNIDSIEAKIAGTKWFHQDPQRHVILYTPKTIKKLLLKNGFKVTKINHFAPEYKHVIIYSILAFWGLDGLNKKIKQFIALILLPLALPLSYLFALLGKSGTIEIYIKKA